MSETKERIEVTQEEKKLRKKGQSAATKPDFHMISIVLMGVFVVFVMIWGAYQSVKLINAAHGTLESSVLKVEDNSKKAGKTIDVDTLIQKILDNVAFEAELNKLEDSVAEGMVETAVGTDMRIYMGNGTFADELLVMTAADETAAKINMENAKTHLEETKKAFRDYLPEEAKKVEKAVCIRCGSYVFVCVTSDYETAEKTINSIIKE